MQALVLNVISRRTSSPLQSNHDDQQDMKICFEMIILTLITDTQSTWTAGLLEFVFQVLQLNQESFDQLRLSHSPREHALDSGMERLSPISSPSICMIAPDWLRPN